MITTPSFESACYEGTIRHRRHGPKENSFSYKLFMAYLDLSELSKVFQLSPWWKQHRLLICPLYAAGLFGSQQHSLGYRCTPAGRKEKRTLPQWSHSHAYPSALYRLLF